MGATVTCDATRAGSLPPSVIIDGVTSITGWAGDVAWFAPTPDADARVNISGFNSAFDIVRIFTEPQDVPNPISIYCSSAVTTSLTVSDPTWSALGTFGSIPGSPTVAPWVQYMGSTAPDRCYIDFHVSAPAGTRSLLVDLGTVDTPNTFGRIWEIELIHTTAVPEPGAHAAGHWPGGAALLCLAEAAVD